MNKPVNIEDFRIRFDLIVRDDISSTSNWMTHPAVLKMVSLIPFKDVYNLFEEVIINEPFVESNMSEYRNWLILAKSENYEERGIYRAMIRDLLYNNKGYGAGNDPNQLYYIVKGGYRGVNLNQPIEILSDHEDFPLLFSFRFSKTKHPAKFLEFHFVDTFNQDRDSFRLKLTMLDKSIISERIEFLNEWREQNLKKQTSSRGSKTIKKQTFELYFGEKTEQARSKVIDFLFDETHGYKGKGKGHRIRQLAGAFEMFITAQHKKYNASQLSQVLQTEFGDRLGNKNSTLLDYTKKEKLIKTEPSVELSKELLSLLTKVNPQSKS
ncbi:MAG: hypothetical protein SGJ02_04410 [bacterium]|nr:hypothetical protein [bacterium]